MNPYIAITGLAALGAIFVLVMVALNLLFSPTQANRTKHETYECGIDPTPQAAGGGRFPVKYYVIAMLYIIFDIEIVFLYPWAVSYGKLGLFAVIEMLLFMVTVFIAYFYVYRRGGLDWD
ncbi:NADH dehydrogenase subunit A [Luteococcus japonicus]|uniref:NADH-quinone oxidoreductase subunit n=2 Tax=Luteococcus japonicus TaxID=33984 RepID=A0A1R4J3G3_9ACTN|nr:MULTISPECIES: NADH-quinone oxidoreductase subunit A [Luteococcus]MDN5562184.1 NADH-quinone oxidoreductase subunit A [Luteococcus sp.]ROR53999.1 NADH dehydrogenase subunit A [Luteococcus japonicus]SJN26315.1 NADH ubiquinone oxidoreductase chain A [Luteococcus japonicus LSP_Lj1]